MEDYLNQKNRYVGKRCVLLVRCSTDQQAETSIPAQQDLLRAFAAANGMAVVGEIVLDGVSGSKPGARDDIQQILDRKRAKNDFEILLVQTEDRLTRGGADHGAWVQYEFTRHGIEIVFASSDAPNGPFASVVRDLKYHSAQEMAKSTSLRSCQGYQRALENGNVATCTHAPYGTHRLYCSAEGKPLFILRDNRDGTQDKLHPETLAILETYGTVGGGAKGHYRKQKSEKVCLVRGEDKEVAVVRRIFQLRYMEGWGGRRIANLLSSEGLKTPHGKRWTQRQVEVVSENETYVGISVADRIGSGRFNQRAKGQGRSVGIVFFEDPNDKNQSAMQFCVESGSYVTPAGVEFTKFDADSTKINYLPRGVVVATLAGNNLFSTSGTVQTRAVIFDAQGQLTLRDGLAVELWGGNPSSWDPNTSYPAGAKVVYDGKLWIAVVPNGPTEDPKTHKMIPAPPPPNSAWQLGVYAIGRVIRTYGENKFYMSIADNNYVNPAGGLQPTYWQEVPWNFCASYESATDADRGFSSPGIVIFDQNEFNNNGATTDAERAKWIQQHADVLVVNAQTGAIIR